MILEAVYNNLVFYFYSRNHIAKNYLHRQTNIFFQELEKLPFHVFKQANDLEFHYNMLAGTPFHIFL